MTGDTRPFGQASAVLPPELRRLAGELPEDWRGRAEELRLRAGRSMTVLVDGAEQPVAGAGPVTEEDLRTVLELASHASAHTVLERVRRGFVTIRGGHRIGLCGTAVMERGEVVNLRRLSSLAIRVAREVPGAAEGAFPGVLSGGRAASTLILAPPGAGKTTLLRDLIRALSQGEHAPPMRVGVADERGELAAVREGVPELELGPHTDVMDGCPKGPGLEMLLRGMNPQVLAVDEITAPGDVEAMLQAAGCGVALLATAHGNSVKDLSLRPLYRALMKENIFQRLVTIRRGVDGRRTIEVEELGK